MNKPIKAKNLPLFSIIDLDQLRRENNLEGTEVPFFDTIVSYFYYNIYMKLSSYLPFRFLFPMITILWLSDRSFLSFFHLSGISPSF